MGQDYSGGRSPGNVTRKGRWLSLEETKDRKDCKDSKDCKNSTCL